MHIHTRRVELRRWVTEMRNISQTISWPRIASVTTSRLFRRLDATVCKTRNADATAIVHDGNKVTVPTNNPLSGRLQAEPAELTSVQRQVAAPASVEADPARYAKILPPLSGHILQLFVHPGDTVKKGQALLSIDAPDFVGAQADYSRSRSALAQAERALERQKDLATHGIVGQKDVEQATADRDAAISDYNRAKERLRLLGMDPDKTQLGAPLIVRSPLSGKVLDVSTAPGVPTIPTFAYDGGRFIDSMGYSECRKRTSTTSTTGILQRDVFRLSERKFQERCVRCGRPDPIRAQPCPFQQ